MRFSFLGLLFLLFLSSFSYAEYNYKSHQREKLSLWMMYNFACDRYGATKQTIVFPQNPNTKNVFTRHIGTGPEGRYTFSEFMSHCSGLVGADVIPEGAIWDPITHGAGAAMEDIDKTYGGLMNMKSMNFKDLLPYVVTMDDVWVSIHAEYLKWRESPELSKLLGKLAPMMDKLAEEIHTLRWESVQNYLADRLTKPIGTHPAMMSDATVNSRASAVPDGPKYKQIDIRETLNTYTLPDGRLRDGFKFQSREQFVSWIDKHGKDLVVGVDRPGEGDREASAKTHYRMKLAWQDLTVRVFLSPGLSAKCPVTP